MDLFHNVKMVRLQSYIGKYLHAKEDQSVILHGDGSTRNVLWTVEWVPGPYRGTIRLKSCYGKYLTRTNQDLLLGFTGSIVIQTLPRIPDPFYVDWKPFRPMGLNASRQAQVLLTAWPYMGVLRGSSGIWRNFVTCGFCDFLGEDEHPKWSFWEVHVVQWNPQPRPQLQVRPQTPTQIQMQPWSRPGPGPGPQQQPQQGPRPQLVHGGKHDKGNDPDDDEDEEDDNDDEDEDDDDEDDNDDNFQPITNYTVNNYYVDNSASCVDYSASSKYGNYAEGNAHIKDNGMNLG